MNQSEDNFIGRWSRRKKEAKSPQLPVTDQEIADSADELDITAELPAKSERDATDTPATNAVDALEQKPASPTDADMVALETLDADSDYSPFMSEGVSSDDDYDDDFTYFEPLGDTVTSDMKYHARRKEKDRLAKLEEERLAVEAQTEPDPATEDTDSTEKTESESGEPRVDDDGATTDTELIEQRPNGADHSANDEQSEVPTDTDEKDEIHLSSVNRDDRQHDLDRQKPESGKNA